MTLAHGTSLAKAQAMTTNKVIGKPESSNTFLDIPVVIVPRCVPTHIHCADTHVLGIQAGSHSPMAVKYKNIDSMPCEAWCY